MVKSLNKLFICAALAAGISGLTTGAFSQELVYQPINPSFGGDSFNSAHLLSIAEIDRPDPPRSSGAASATAGLSQTDLFVRQLESRILSRLSTDITDAIFGPEADPSGSFSLGDTDILFETLLDGTVIVTIVDVATGGETTIEVPGFLSASQ